MRIGASLLAVDDAQVLAIVEYVEPTPLPFAPPSVLGIVSLEGKMFTVLETTGVAQTRKYLLALRGDEQLAIAIDECERPAEIERELVNRPETATAIYSHATVSDGQRDIPLLDVDKLFSGILQGRERRRRRL
jgi:chemotaxis signal transduction protein